MVVRVYESQRIFHKVDGVCEFMTDYSETHWLAAWLHSAPLLATDTHVRYVKLHTLNSYGSRDSNNPILNRMYKFPRSLNQ